MTTEEFSNEFDVLLDSYRRFKDFDNKEELDSLDFDEYEKSIFLTKAQEQIVVELYTGRNEKGAPFERTEELRNNLKNLIRTVDIKPSNNGYNGLSSESIFFALPADLLYITYESAILGDDNAGCSNGSMIEVVPVTQDVFHRTMRNPFKQANRKRALRLDNGYDIAEIVSKYKIDSYKVRYLAKPTPIVLTDFSEVTVNGVNKRTECELDSILHRPILERAILLAVRSKGVGEK